MSDMVFQGDGPMLGVEFTPAAPDEDDEQPARPHVFDWCRPGSPPSQHAKCHREYTTRWKPDPTVCECTCHTREEDAS